MYSFKLVCLIFGVIFLNRCDSHSVNINSTWTLPKEGYPVFYRYFRDKISWYEADAVCQFHHATLATVGNGIHFDATRDFLRELDVVDKVWIGLKRIQGSKQFMWSSSKWTSLTNDYWADPLPIIDSSLCAVIDPVRDYRWHALHCGGPETAAFLCEMEVPEWVTDCLVRGIPSLTIQYMSESATIELFRDCGDEGIKHMSCRGKQDISYVQSELICSSENLNNESDNNNFLIDSGLDNEKKDETTSLDELSSDNTEENAIEQLVKGINMEEMMMGDQPIVSEVSSTTMNGLKQDDVGRTVSLTSKTATVTREPRETTKSISSTLQPTITTTTAITLLNETLKTDHKHAIPAKGEGFIPPMLMVRSNFTVNDANETVSTTTKLPLPMVTSTSTRAATVPSSNSSPTTIHPQTSTVSIATTTVPSSAPNKDENLIETTTSQPIKVSTNTPLIGNITQIIHSPTSAALPVVSTEQTMVTATIPGAHQEQSETDFRRTNMLRPHAPKFGGEISYFASPKNENDENAKTNSYHDIPIQPNTTITTIQANNTIPIQINVPTTVPTNLNSSVISTTEFPTNLTIGNATIPPPEKRSATNKHNENAYKHQHDHKQTGKHGSHDPHDPNSKDHKHEKHADFSNSDVDYVPYKPNRRRIVTKPETHTYIQKIFG